MAIVLDLLLPDGGILASRAGRGSGPAKQPPDGAAPVGPRASRRVRVGGATGAAVAGAACLVRRPCLVMGSGQP
jgi:hypothetical protein